MSAMAGAMRSATAPSMPLPSRRALLLAPLAASAPARNASAQNWPNRTVTLVVPFAAGGNVDAVARLLAPELSRRLGGSVVVENAPGAGGIIGTERVARAAPDGHTLLLGVESAMVIAGLVSPRNVRYRAADFAPVALLATSPLVLVGRPDLPADTAAELLALARAAPAPLTYATSGIGTSLHLTGELIAQRAGVRMEHVPYRVSAQIGPDLVAGRLDLAVLTLTSVLPLVRDGQVKAYGVSEAERTPLLPQVPSLSETPALRDVRVTVWHGLFAPARTDPTVLGRLEAETGAALADPALRARLESLGARPGVRPGAAFAAFLRREAETYGAVVRASGISVD